MSTKHEEKKLKRPKNFCFDSKTALRFHPTPVRVSIIKKTNTDKDVDRQRDP